MIVIIVEVIIVWMLIGLLFHLLIEGFKGNKLVFWSDIIFGPIGLIWYVILWFKYNSKNDE